MRAPDDKVRVQKPKRVLVGVLDESDFWETCHPRTGLVPGFNAKPSNPQKFHALSRMFRGLRVGCRDVGVVDPEDLGIPVWVNASSILGRPEHNVGVGVGVDRIAVAADVVCCVVHGKLAG